MIRLTGLVLSLAAWLILAASAFAAEPRVALVVGVSAYKNAAALPNTLNDANGVAGALGRLGFKVDTVLDPDRAALEAAVRRFGDAAKGAEAAVFFYAGHALEVGGRNWLLPASMALKEARDLRFEALDVDSLLEQTEGVARITLLFLDSCRDNPFQKRLTTGGRDLARGGLGQVSAGTGTLVAFSTAPGTTAADGNGRNSPFTTALLRHIETPGLEVRPMLSLVRKDVREATRGAQIPWENSALEGAFYFKPDATPPAKPAVPTAPADADLVFWQSIKDSTEASDFEAYLARFPNGTFAPLAKRRAATTAMAPPPGTSAPVPAAAAPAPSQAFLYDAMTRRVSALAPKLVRGDEKIGSYVRERGHKAFAVSAEPPGTWRLSAAQSAEEAATSALASCRIRWGAACTLVAVDDALAEAPPPDWSRRVSEQVGYVGPFDPSKVPVPEARRAREDVAGYRARSGPKAAALHPWRRLFVAGGANQREAETAALAACNDDPVRQGKDGPCYLYAAGDDVVLPQRRTVPRAPPEPGTAGDPNMARITAAVAQIAIAKPEAPAKPDAVGEGQETIEQRLRKVLSAGGGDAGAAARYVTLGAHKAFAVQAESGRNFIWNGLTTDANAEAFTLEACQLRYGTPCILLALDDDVRAADLKAAPRRSMARIAYASGYAPDKVPFALARQDKDREAYGAAAGPKAMAIHVPKGVFWARGATSAEAQAKALAACNDADAAYPCFLYAIDDRVVLPQRRTEAAR